MRGISEREADLPTALIGKLLKIASEDKKVISLSVGEPDFDAPKEIITEARKILAKYKKNRVTHYSAPEGITILREAIAKKLKKENKINTTPDNILVTAGSQQALFSAFVAALDPTEEVIVPNPGYLAYVPGIELVSAVPRYVKLKEEDKWEVNPDKIKRAVTKKTRAIILNTPSNPTGTVLRKKILEEVADIAVNKDLYIFSDEAYEQLVYGHKKHVSIGSLNGMEDYVATFQSFSKTYAMCGFRIGYVSGPKPLIKAMQNATHYITLCPPHLSQLVALKALKMSKKPVAEMRRKYNTRRLLITRRLNEMGLPTHKPEGAFYAFANIKNYSKSSLSFTKTLLKKANVATVPGTEFGSAGEGYVRFSYATSYKNIETAMNRVEKFLTKK